MTAASTRASHHVVTPYLMATDTEQVITFLITVFEGLETRRTLRSDRKIDHAEVQIGDSTIMLGEISTDWEPLRAALYIDVRDIEDTYRRAIDAGAISYMAPDKLPDSTRMAAIRDPFGNVWWIATRR